MLKEIDIDDEYWYAEKNYPDKPDVRTRERLIEIKELGYTECGIGQFGIDGITSGLYIEILWDYDNERWLDYINWVKKLINEKLVDGI